MSAHNRNRGLQPPLDLEITKRERDKRFAETQRMQRVSNPADRKSIGIRDLAHPGLEYVGSPAYWIRRKIKP